MVLQANNSLRENKYAMFPSNISVKTAHTYQNNPEMLTNLDVPLYF